MTKTTAELRESVARKIKILRNDMPLDSADAVTIDDCIEEVTDYYRERGVIWWADNAIPDACMLPMALMVASWAAEDFGKEVNPSWAQNGLVLLQAIKNSSTIDEVLVEPY
jgi:hypothetical protein